MRGPCKQRGKLTQSATNLDRTVRLRIVYINSSRELYSSTLRATSFLSMSTHSAIATISKGEFDIIDVPTKSPGEGEILLKAEYSAMIPFDTYQTDLGYAVQQYPTILGFNASGVVVDVGSGVKDLVAGDRVRTSG